jgi:long-subunit acyl-CoA synthetase (AMP-forming)
VLHVQVHSLTEAWAVCGSDRVLHVLPLHHIHGIVNALYTPHCSGAAVEFQRR